LDEQHFYRHKRHKTGFSSRCIECEKAYVRGYQTNPRTRDRYRASHKRADLKKNYGITEEHVEALKRRQVGCCGICGQPAKLFVDHCHQKIFVRGLLCNVCNMGLGNFRDDPNLLTSAIRYLTERTQEYTDDVFKNLNPVLQPRRLRHRRVCIRLANRPKNSGNGAEIPPLLEAVRVPPVGEVDARQLDAA
jgi:hypothetical protein